jgi:hypothetical protein
MATMRYTQSATEMIPRMIFSIKVELELFATDRVKREGRKKHDDNSDVNDVQHNFQQTPSSHKRDNAAHFIMGELENRFKNRPSNRRRG